MTMPLYHNIEDLIPQKAPFLLVDKFIANGDNVAECRFKVPVKHPLVHRGKLSGGGLVENMAQTAAAGNGYMAKVLGLDVPKGFIAGIRNLKIERLPESNSELFTKTTQLEKIMGFIIVRGEVYADNEIVACCEMKIYCPE